MWTTTADAVCTCWQVLGHLQVKLQRMHLRRKYRPSGAQEAGSHTLRLSFQLRNVITCQRLDPGREHLHHGNWQTGQGCSPPPARTLWTGAEARDAQQLGPRGSQLGIISSSSFSAQSPSGKFAPRPHNTACC